MADEGSVQLPEALGTPWRDTTIVLRDHTNFTAWFQQLELRCVAHNVWDIVNPAKTTLPGQKPTEIRAPAFSDF
ncbi:hypothetical protein PTT_10872 [Pyrenophora teres f. teres 0-1]|uniref:Uncharacterized protein n=1 Tax=Pyrenophora teres f. teres (strain 0-1) TaxID=861557 RepID=E3RQ96_PYRTT|nr:hypothetical protein PTT_10872 [Pyrenophora teres f. teres 0-1]